MLSLLIAIGTATAPVAANAAVKPCAPNKHTICRTTVAATSSSAFPAKRCHPDSTKAVGCREAVITKSDRRTTEKSK